MFQASVNVRGTQIRHSDRLRISVRAPCRVTRPTWDMASSVQRPTNRRRRDVRVSELSIAGATASIFAPHGPQVYPCRAVGRRSAAEFRRRLLRWFRRHGRDLPWRRTRDPYHVLVSEFMLQQTQVSRVEEYYHRFLERVPDRRGPGAARRRRWCGRAGRGWATTAAPPTCTGWRRRSCADHGGVIPADPDAAAAAARRRPLHGGRGGELRLRAGDAGRGHQRRAGDPPGVPSQAAGARRRAPTALGDRRRDRAPATGRRPGRSIRRSWSWARWCARRGWRGAGSARCGACATGRRTAEEQQEVAPSTCAQDDRAKSCARPCHPERSEGARPPR